MASTTRPALLASASYLVMTQMTREWFEKDYYAALGVAASASPKDITTAYRRLARQFHPDANPGDSTAEEKFKEVSAAYDVVGDPERRKEYDQVRAMGPMGSRLSGGGPGGGFGRPGDATFNGADLGDIIGKNVLTSAKQERRSAAPSGGPPRHLTGVAGPPAGLG